MVENIIIVAVLALIIGAAVLYIVKAKKSGVKCVGCPHSKECKSCNCGFSDKH